MMDANILLIRRKGLCFGVYVAVYIIRRKFDMYNFASLGIKGNFSVRMSISRAAITRELIL